MFATGPRAVGFTIVWPEGVIFSSMMTYHVQFLLLVVAGWVNRQQQDVIDYQQEENRVLRAGLEEERGKRLKLSDDDRRRLAVKAQALGREALAQIASVATPATLLRWYRCLIVAKYDRGKRLKLSDDDRRRLAVKAQALGREALAQIASVATPATLLRWYRCLIVAKYDGSKNRGACAVYCW